MFFFFQAEDGIRDRDVTGVQTCALPIFDNRRINKGEIAANVPAEDLLPHVATAPAPFSDGEDRWVELRVDRRSEERRVGKECRSRRWAGIGGAEWTGTRERSGRVGALRL